MPEPTYYYFRFRIALFCVAFFFVISIASHFRTIEFRDKYEAQLSAHVKDLKALNQCNADLDMTIDLYTSNGNIAIMQFYCDRFKRYQDRRLRQGK
jgi:hypothetical protein